MHLAELAVSSCRSVSTLAAVTRVSSRLVFPRHDGEYLRQVTFRQIHWTPALGAAGVEHRRVYGGRHTFASWAIAASVQLLYLSRNMGTSITQIDATYGHFVPDSEEYLRALLDAYDLRGDESTKVVQQRVR